MAEGLSLLWRTMALGAEDRRGLKSLALQGPLPRQWYPSNSAVIAFPKTQSASDLLFGSPDFISDEQLDELSILVKEKEEE